MSRRPQVVVAVSPTEYGVWWLLALGVQVTLFAIAAMVWLALAAVYVLAYAGPREVLRRRREGRWPWREDATRRRTRRAGT